MGIAVVSASVLTEEGQVHDSGHVGGGHRCGNHAHNKHDRVSTVGVAFAFEEAPATSTGQDLVL